MALRMNGKALGKRDYRIDGNLLRIPNAPDEVMLEIETICAPEKNTTLTGLYVSNGNFFTQCEAEGFRRITYFPDRPDVMAKYTVMLRADKATLSGAAVERQPDRRGRPAATAATTPSGKTRSRSRPTCSRWSPRNLVCQEETFTLADGRDGAAAGVGRRGQPRQDRLRDAVAQAQRSAGTRNASASSSTWTAS